MRGTLGILVGLLVATTSAAQDANYWNLQYGPVGQLLGGQVIASSRDVTATFYNPGGLALDEGTTFLLSTESFQAESFSTTAKEEGLELFETSSTRFGSAPTLVAGSLPRRWLGEDTRLAWSFLTRQELKVRLGRRLNDTLELPGLQTAAELYLDQEISEHWAGLTVSRRLSDTLGVGLTWYGIYRGQRSRNELSLAGVSREVSAVNVLGISEFKYNHFRTLAKLGVAWERRDLRFGLNVTTPSAGLFGSGEVGYIESLVGMDADGDGAIDSPYLGSLSREGLETDYKSSWAIGAGIAWYRGATRWHMSAEWFAPVSRFTVIELETDEPDRQLRLTQALDNVFNAGLGVEHGLRNGVVLYGAAHTDFSAATADPTANVAISNWNLYHISGGVKFFVAGSQFTLGTTLSFGSEKRALPSPLPPGLLPQAGLDTEGNIRYRRLVVLLGFLFGDD
jgi:hypothetical protein